MTENNRLKSASGSFLMTSLADIALTADDGDPRVAVERQRLVNTVFEGEIIEPSKPLYRDPMGRPFKVVASPEVLNFRNNLVELIRFLTKMRRSVLRRDRRVFVDLSPCKSIDVVACLLLTAEIERCHTLCPGYIYGCDPSSGRALGILRQLGFHEHLKLAGDRQPLASEWTATIRSGQGNEQEISPIMADVAALAFRAWGDQAFADQIHAALNEAMTNVIMHAYPDEIVDAEACLPGRWWAAGIVNKESNEAWFLALDHGVGIPRTAIRNFEGLLKRFGIAEDRAEDHLVIAAAVKEARTQTGLDQHGKGLASMIRVIDEKASGGSIVIASKAGEHVIVKNPAQKNPLLARVEFGRRMEDELPGTLIVWKVNGPIKDKAN